MITEKDLSIGQEIDNNGLIYKITKIDHAKNDMFYDMIDRKINPPSIIPNSYPLSEIVKLINKGNLTLLTPLVVAAKPQEIEFKVGQIWREIARANNPAYKEGSFAEYKIKAIANNNIVFEPTGNLSDDRNKSEYKEYIESIQSLQGYLEHKSPWKFYMKLMDGAAPTMTKTINSPKLIQCPNCGCRDQNNYISCFSVECVNPKCFHHKKG